MTLQIIPPEARTIRLCRIVGDNELKMTEGAEFDDWQPIETALRRAAVSGFVGFNMELGNYWADIGTSTGNHLMAVTLDRDSFKSLKERWLKVKYWTPELAA